MDIIKAGSTQILKEDAEKIYNENKYICNYSGIFQPFKSADNTQIYFKKIIDCKGYAGRGRFYVQDAKTINHVLGENIIMEV